MAPILPRNSRAVGAGIANTGRNTTSHFAVWWPNGPEFRNPRNSPVFFTRKHRVQRMMQIVAPLRFQAAAAAFLRKQNGGIVQVALGDYVDLAPVLLRHALDALLQLRQKMPRTAVEHPVNRIQPQRVDVIFLQPEDRIFDEKPSDVIAIWAIEINGLSPRAAIVVGKVGTKLPQIVSFGPEMVVDHVQRHIQSGAMGCVDEALESLGAAITVLNRIKMVPSYPQFRSPGNCASGINWRVVTPNLFNLEMGNGGIKSSFRRENSDVQLIKYRFLQPDNLPTPVFPLKTIEVDDLRRPVHPVGLKSRRRIGQVPHAVQSKCIPVTRLHPRKGPGVISKWVGFKRNQP